MAANTLEVVAFVSEPGTEEEATVSPAPHKLVVVLYEAEPQTTRKIVSSASTMSGSVEVERNCTVPPGAVAPPLAKVVKTGLRFTLKGELFVAVVP